MVKGEGNIWRPRESRSLVLKKPSLSFRQKINMSTLEELVAVGEKLQLTGKDLQAFIAPQKKPKERSVG